MGHFESTYFVLFRRKKTSGVEIKLLTTVLTQVTHKTLSLFMMQVSYVYKSVINLYRNVNVSFTSICLPFFISSATTDLSSTLSGTENISTGFEHSPIILQTTAF